MAGKQRQRSAAPERHERMSAVDTAWLRMDGAGNTMMIVSVMASATPIRAADLRQVIATRLLCFPRFLRRPVPDPLGASWHQQADFDLDAHFVVTQLPEPAGKAELQQLAARLAGERLDPGRPLWQVHFVEHYGSGSAWVLRVHHCYADGMAMVRVLLSLTEQDSGPAFAAAQVAASRRVRRAEEGDSRGAAPRPLMQWLDHLTQPAGDILENALAEGARLLESGVHQLFHPDDAAQLAAQASGMVGEFARVLGLPDDPATPLRGALSGAKQVGWSAPLELADVKTVGKALGCTVNDVLMATVAGALGAHLRDAHAFDTANLVLRASVPINLRAAEEPMALGNKFGLVFVDLPVGTGNPLQRVFRMHDTMTALKGSLQPPMSLLVLGMMGMMPSALQAPAIELFSRKGTLVASNVPGPQAPLYLCGQRISEMYFWVPQSGSMGIGISILSYAGKVFFGIIADRNLLPEPGAVVDRFGPEFERLLLGATVGLLALGERRSARATSHARAKVGRQKKSPVGYT
ncbi:MAG TPA: wax ester/triacylglycerol synthase family O-acyltransferase [Steroidobacteraceae bacterium]|nr:wax ester/triacylglycerol synthase family O-acyltransferase [Steroidobacteraceae bacterium]